MCKKTIIRLPSVMVRTGLARSSIYHKISVGEFPRPVKLGPRAVGWIESEIEEHNQSCIDASRPDKSRPDKSQTDDSPTDDTDR